MADIWTNILLLVHKCTGLSVTKKSVYFGGKVRGIVCFIKFLTELDSPTCTDPLLLHSGIIM